MNKTTSALLSTCILILTSQFSQAGSATWAQTPADSNWSNPSNWIPNTVPNSTTDVATFDASNITDISLVDSINVQGLIFDAGASAYTLTLASGKELTVNSGGIVNNSGVEQELVAAGGKITVFGGNVASLTHFHVLGTDATHPAGTLWIWDFSGVVGNATIDVEGSSIRGAARGEAVIFSSTGSSTIVLHRGLNGGAGGTINFQGASASTSNITCEASDLRNTAGGSVGFGQALGAASSTITLQGSDVPGAIGGSCSFGLSASAEAATLIADGGNAVGGSIVFTGTPSGGTARIVINANAVLDISGLVSQSSGITIGSLEGERKGHVFLGSKKLSIGSNNTSTVYSGVIQDGGLSGGTGGSVAKVGTRTLTLTGANLYTGGTTVTLGDVLVANRTGSATGTGPVQVNAGRIGGAGTIAGPLTIGTGSGSGAILIPAAGTKREVTTTIESALTLKADATYNCAVNTITGASDSVVANGVMIDPSATFVLHPKGTGTLVSGTMITPINNTAATPISGSFNGLTEGSTITVGNNTYQVSYIGGDGNDFTLTAL
jgi:autotransporter-associated beta strand protein